MTSSNRNLQIYGCLATRDCDVLITGTRISESNVDWLVFVNSTGSSHNSVRFFLTRRQFDAINSPRDFPNATLVLDCYAINVPKFYVRKWTQQLDLSNKSGVEPKSSSDRTFKALEGGRFNLTESSNSVVNRTRVVTQWAWWQFRSESVLTVVHPNNSNQIVFNVDLDRDYLFPYLDHVGSGFVNHYHLAEPVAIFNPVPWQPIEHSKKFDDPKKDSDKLDLKKNSELNDDPIQSVQFSTVTAFIELTTESTTPSTTTTDHHVHHFQTTLSPAPSTVKLISPTNPTKISKPQLANHPKSRHSPLVFLGAIGAGVITVALLLSLVPLIADAKRRRREARIEAGLTVMSSMSDLFGGPSRSRAMSLGSTRRSLLNNSDRGASDNERLV